jgi:predicted ester cyclase
LEYRLVRRTASMSVETNKNIVERFVKQVWYQHDVRQLDAFVDEGFRGHGPSPMEWYGPSSIQHFFQQMSTIQRFGGVSLRYALQDLIAEGDRVVTRLTAEYEVEGDWAALVPDASYAEETGLMADPHPRSTVVIIHRIEGGRIAEQWILFDDPRTLLGESAPR